MNARRILAGLALVLAVAAPVRAGAPDGYERLVSFLERTHTMRADFQQEIVRGMDQPAEASTGTMALERPGKFRWDYAQPYERAVVADGRQLWLYEADLEQVTVRPLDAGLGETPAALLTGERAALDRFEHVKSWMADGLAWVRLRPRSADSDFESVAVAFAGEVPARLELVDRLGQTTRLVFSRASLNPHLAANLFTFEVPEGVDVIREGEP